MTPEGQRIQTHVDLAIQQNRAHIELAVEQAKRSGIGVFVHIRFAKDRIVVFAEPNVRVPLGKIMAPNFENFKWKNSDGEDG